MSTRVKIEKEDQHPYTKDETTDDQVVSEGGAMKTLDMLQILKRREKDIAIEESSFSDRKVSERVTFKVDEPMRTQRLPNGHYLQG